MDKSILLDVVNLKKHFPIRTGVLFYKAVSSFKPNYYVDYLKDSPWIHMPYEKYEGIKVTDL